MNSNPEITILLPLCLVLSAASCLAAPPGLKATEQQPITNYRQILDGVPSDLGKIKPTKWTTAQRKLANESLATSLAVKNPTFRMTLKMLEVADWPKLTFFAEIKNNEGHKIRVFAGFDEKWRPLLSAMKQGTSAEIEGRLVSTRYGNLWGDFSLNLSVHDCRLVGVDEPK
jgi:hypothetical protein